MAVFYEAGYLRQSPCPIQNHNKAGYLVMVNDLSGAEHHVRIKREATVRELKERIATDIRVPVHAQKLAAESVVLDKDDLTVGVAAPMLFPSSELEQSHPQKKACTEENRVRDSLQGSSVEIGKIQRRLAWPPCKDDFHKSRFLSKSRAKAAVPCSTQGFSENMPAEPPTESNIVSRSSYVTLVRVCSDEEASLLMDLEDAARCAQARLARHALGVDLQQLGDMARACIPPQVQTMLTNPRFVENALKLTSKSFRWLRPGFIILARSQLREKDIAKVAMQLEPGLTTMLEPDLLKDRELLLIAVRWSGPLLQHADQASKADKDIVLLAVQQDGSALEFASDSLKADPEVVMIAVQQEGRALQFASLEMQGRMEIAIAAIQSCGLALAYVAPALRADRGLVEMAVQRTGNALQFADATFQEDRDLVISAVKSSGKSLKFAHRAFRSDRSIAMLALAQSAYAFDCVSAELQADQDLILAACRMAVQRGVPNFAKDISSGDEETCLAQVVQTKGLQALNLGPALEDAILRRRLFAIAALRHDPAVYKRLQDSFKEDASIAMELVKKNGLFLADVPYSTRSNFGLQVVAVAQNKLAVNLAHPADRKIVQIEAERRIAELAQQVRHVSD